MSNLRTQSGKKHLSALMVMLMEDNGFSVIKERDWPGLITRPAGRIWAQWVKAHHKSLPPSKEPLGKVLNHIWWPTVQNGCTGRLPTVALCKSQWGLSVSKGRGWSVEYSRCAAETTFTCTLVPFVLYGSTAAPRRVSCPRLPVINREEQVG